MKTPPYWHTDDNTRSVELPVGVDEETGVDNIVALADGIGSVFDFVASPMDESDRAAIREQIATVAERTLPPGQASIFLAHLAGMANHEIATARSCQRSVVGEALYGRPAKGSRKAFTGAIVKMKAALANDPAFSALASKIGTKDEPDFDYRGFFAPCRPGPMHHLVGPLLVLYVAHRLAGASRKASVTELMTVLPAALVVQALPVVRGMGWAIFDNTDTLNIIELPTEQV